MTAIAPRDRYRRLDLLGRGGMGEVLLADDLLLKRKVAIKIVHRSALSNPRAEKLLRREAKAAAALDNPFICKVYEVSEDDGGVFIAMEYIQGETLRQRMIRGPIPTRDVVSLAREIADGLDEADRKRIIHRDLKPSNIIITPQGHVKIMDFGLAKRLPGDESIEESSAGTPDGMVVGTREYMSPEQLRGKPLEPSSDLFALGLILFEMVAGHHPLRKASAIDTQFAILNEIAPDLSDVCPGAPEDLCDLVEALLRKSAADRPRIGEVRERLASISDSARPEAKERTLGTSASVEAFVARKPRLVLALGLGLVLALIALSLWIGFRPEPTMPQAKMATLVTWPSNEEQAVLSPDSKNLSFISNRDGVKDIWLMDLSGGEPRRITHAPGNLTAQTFSEDGAEIAYTLESETEKLFQTIRIDGGPPTRSVALPADTRIRRMIRWVGMDVFMETETVQLVRLSLPDGKISAVPTLPRDPHRPGQWDVSRDGRSLTFAAQNDDGSTSIWTKASGESPRPITKPGQKDASPFFSDRSGQGRIFFESDRSGQPDLWFIERAGREPRQVTFGSNREFIESVSADGQVIVFSEVLESGSIFSFDPRTGNRVQLTAENTHDVTPSVSRDGLIAFSRTPLSVTSPWQSTSILTGYLRNGVLDGVRTVAREGFGPQISPDGRRLAFMSRPAPNGPPRMNLLEVGTGHTRDLGEKPLRSLGYMNFAWSFYRRDYAWSARGDLVFTEGSADLGSRIMRIDPEGVAAELTRLSAGESATHLTPGPDGRRIFFVRTSAQKPGGEVIELSSGRTSALFSSAQGSMAILGLSEEGVLVVHQPRLDGPAVLLSLSPGKTRDRFQFQAVPNSWRYVAGLNGLAFSRRDARDVENVFLKDLETGKETALTANGIQGIAFSPVSQSGSGPLVFSQQLRNKDLSIIRLDR